ncbi:hypothetical protein KUTeg_017946 [Tegillarca granosa]|uniref:Peptidyl-prolyl cis-trans isomerase n=1 Tax=Tegillarca granosa TaxID=220873 RepID=A0ABQ9EM66_TEGGR|nr:hypothetical protein KUTeg_017946 [Tegillarca granosa]
MFPFLLFATTQAKSKYTITDEVWFDVKIYNYNNTGQVLDGTFVVGVFGDALPITTTNFIQLAKGFSPNYKDIGKIYSYKRSFFHRIIPDFVIQTNEFLHKGILSYYGSYFRDEGFLFSHVSAGYVGMANHGKNTNGASFYITLRAARHLDGKNVLFGKIVSGMKIIRAIADVPTDRSSSPIRPVMIEDCGVVHLKEKYKLTEEQIKSNDDIKKSITMYTTNL